ncbi:MAG: DNRLRE domain-containing protein [Deltaproteobacteria bacterium]|nr:DNRLRE domain-containing protein [Deltaproteobacteria bacterium]
MNRSKLSYRNIPVLFLKIFIADFLLFCLLMPLIAQETVKMDPESLRLEPVADSHVYAFSYLNWNKANWGTYENLAVGWHPTGGEKRTFLRFNLSGIDLQGMNKAKLRLYLNHMAGAPILKLGVHKVTGRWAEGQGTYPGKPDLTVAPGEITWAAQPPFEKFAVASFSPGADIHKYVEVDVTELVTGWLSGEPNYGLVITPMGTLGSGTRESVYGFYSREHKDKTKRPILIFQSTGEADNPDEKRAGTELSVAGGRGNWWMFMHDPQHSGRSPYRVADKPVVKWKFDLHHNHSWAGGAVIGVDGTIYCGSTNCFYALNPDGNLKWKYDFGIIANVLSTPAIGEDGTIYFGTTLNPGYTTYEGSIYALTPDGKLKWKNNLRSAVYGSPTIGPDGTIYIAEEGAVLHAFNPDGTRKGIFGGGGTTGFSSPVIGKDGTVYFPTVITLPGSLAALDQDLKLKWDYSNYRIYSAAIGSVYIGGSLEESIYIASEKYLCALSTDGRLKWKHPISLNNVGSHLAVGLNGTIYLKGAGYFYAILPDGALLWKYYGPFTSGSSPAIDADGTIIFGNLEAVTANRPGAVYALNPDGTLKWKLSLPKGAGKPTITSDGTILVVCENGYLYAIGSIMPEN